MFIAATYLGLCASDIFFTDGVAFEIIGFLSELQDGLSIDVNSKKARKYLLSAIFIRAIPL
jgi:hypothetical protein